MFRLAPLAETLITVSASPDLANHGQIPAPLPDQRWPHHRQQSNHQAGVSDRAHGPVVHLQHRVSSAVIRPFLQRSDRRKKRCQQHQTHDALHQTHIVLAVAGHHCWHRQHRSSPAHDWSRQYRHAWHCGLIFRQSIYCNAHRPHVHIRRAGQPDQPSGHAPANPSAMPESWHQSNRHHLSPLPSVPSSPRR